MVTVLCAAMAVVFLVASIRHIQLLVAGKSTTATLVQKLKKSDADAGWQWVGIVAYTVENGDSVEVKADGAGHYQIGDTVNIRYLPNNYNRTMVGNQVGKLLIKLLLLLIAIVLLINTYPQ